MTGSPAASGQATSTYTAGSNSGTDNDITAHVDGQTVTLSPGITIQSSQYELTTSANPLSGGSVSPVSGPYNPTSVVSLQATPAAGYGFVNWTSSLLRRECDFTQHYHHYE